MRSGSPTLNSWKQKISLSRTAAAPALLWTLQQQQDQNLSSLFYFQISTKVWKSSSFSLSTNRQPYVEVLDFTPVGSLKRSSCWDHDGVISDLLKQSETEGEQSVFDFCVGYVLLRAFIFVRWCLRRSAITLTEGELITLEPELIDVEHF